MTRSQVSRTVRACRWIPSRAVLPKPMRNSSPTFCESRLDLDDQAGVAELNPVASRRSVDGGVVVALHAGSVTCTEVAGGSRLRQRLLLRAGCVERAVNEACEADDDALPADRRERRRWSSTRVESHRRARRRSPDGMP